MWKRQPLGHGIGLRHTHYADLLANGPRGVSWFEAISENFFEPGGRPRAVLEKVRSHVPVALHGVSLGIGNTNPLCTKYLDSLKRLIKEVEPAWVSDHLCWGAYGGHHSHDLLPLPYTEEALSHVVSQVHKVQEQLGQPILLENVSSYVAFASNTLTEWDFLNEVASQTECGILLDINNIYVSAHNHGFSAETYLDAITPGHVGQFHLAGHTDHGTHLLDSHIGPVPNPVWALYTRAVGRFGRVPTLIEWDEEIPEYAAMVAESERAAQLEDEAIGHA